MFSLQTYKSEKNIKPLLIMRNSTFRKFLLFLLLLPTFLCTTAWAQLSELEQGKVYRFVNVGQSSYALPPTTPKGGNGQHGHHRQHTGGLSAALVRDRG